MTEPLERQIIEVIATDRIHIPISSMEGKLKRKKPKLGKEVDLGDYDNNFQGDRVYARVEPENKMKARGMKEAIDVFEVRHPKYGAELRGLIAEQRELSETHLYFGVNEGCRLTADDYMGVMTDLGFTENTAQQLYPNLMDISRNMSRKRDEERSVLIGAF